MGKDLNKQHIALLFTLYTTQFLGLAFFTDAFIGILRQSGVSLESLGFVYMLGLFWVFRFLWAPFIDRFSIKGLGHYRGWIIVFQSLMVTVLVVAAQYNFVENAIVVVGLSVLFAFFSASQTIALDALVLKSVSLKHRPTANALKSAGNMIGMVLGGGMGLMLYSHFGWQNTLLIMALITSISLIQILIYDEPKQQRDEHQTKIDFWQYIEFWKGKRRKHWLLFLMIYPATISAAFGLIIPMLVDLKWELDKIGLYVHMIGYGIGVMASFIASWVMQKYGKRKVLVVAAIGQTLGVMLLLFLAYGYDSPWIVMFVVGFIFSFYTPSAVVMSTLIMNESSEKTPASQLAIQYGIYMFSGIVFSAVSVSLSGVFGYVYVILAASIIGMLAVYASTKIGLKPVDDQ